MKYFLTIILFYTHCVYSQSDTLNKRNANDKKNGYWKVYLDDKSNPTDSVNAYFFGLELYDNGEGVFQYFKAKWKKQQRLVFEGTTPRKGFPVAIKGKFTWYDKKNKLSAEETYDNGQPIYLKSFGCDDSRPYEDLDFTKKYNNIPGTYFYQEYSRSCSENKIVKYWFRKGDGGWKAYPIDN